jgi:hypothetical protein
MANGDVMRGVASSVFMTVPDMPFLMFGDEDPGGVLTHNISSPILNFVFISPPLN